MLLPPSLRSMVSVNGWVMPGIPACPKNRAHSDQPSAASVPMETRVSMVAVPCRRLVQAALWNGQAPYATTGAARVSDSHCQLVNCSAGTIAIRITGTARSTETVSRCRSAASGSAPGSGAGTGPRAVPGSGGGGAGAGGSGTAAV